MAWIQIRFHISMLDVKNIMLTYVKAAKFQVILLNFNETKNDVKKT